MVQDFVHPQYAWHRSRDSTLSPRALTPKKHRDSRVMGPSMAVMGSGSPILSNHFSGATFEQEGVPCLFGFPFWSIERKVKRNPRGQWGRGVTL